jgi:HAMP domain-containing protein
MIAEVFEELARSREVSVDALWRVIDTVIAKTIFAASDALCQGIADVDMMRRPRSMPYPRYFQLLGFDILFDEQWKPWIIEVNYRPSLEFGTDAEWAMKVRLLKDVIEIAAPYHEIEEYLLDLRRNATGAVIKAWLERNEEVFEAFRARRAAALARSQFVEVLGPANWGDFTRSLGPRSDAVQRAPVLSRPEKRMGQQPQILRPHLKQRKK